MLRLMTVPIAAMTMLLAAPAMAQVATPAIFSPDRIVPMTNALVADRLAKSKAMTSPSAEGLDQIESAQMLDPQNKAVLQYVAYHAQGRGYPLIRYATILEFLPEDPLAAYGVAELMAGDGHHQLALPYYARAVAAYPTSNYYGYRAGLSAYFAGDYAACVRYLDLALTKLNTSNTADQYVKRAECHASLGHKVEAKRDFRLAAEEWAGHASAWSAVMFKDGAYGGCRGTAESRTQASIRQREKGDRYKAYLEATIALQCDPNHIGALEAILAVETGDANLKQHAEAHRIRLSDARDGGKTSADYASWLKPRTPEQMLAEAENIYKETTSNHGQRRRAVYLTTRILKSDPGNVRARLIRAAALVQLNIPALAPMSWDDATRVLKAQPGNAPAHEIRATWLDRNKLNEEAITEITLAIATNPKAPRYYRLRGDVLARVGRTGPAIADLTTALKLAPNHEWTLMKRGEIYIEAKNYPAAYADFEAASLVDKSDLTPKVAMVRTLDLMGNTAKADEMHQTLVRNDTSAQNNAYLVSRAKPQFAAQANGERTQSAQAARVARADTEYRGIIADWEKVVECYDAHSAVVARAEGKVDREGRNGWAGMISDVNRPCYKRAWDLSNRLNSLLISPDFAALSPGRQTQLRDEVQPQLRRAFGDLLATRRMLGWSEEP